jgi:hypothetical protein
MKALTYTHWQNVNRTNAELLTRKRAREKMRAVRKLAARMTKRSGRQVTW